MQHDFRVNKESLSMYKNKKGDVRYLFQQAIKKKNFNLISKQLAHDCKDEKYQQAFSSYYKIRITIDDGVLFLNVLSVLTIFYRNKNTLTGPANCKKITRHHAHLSLCAKSRKTNDAKSRKQPKASIWAIFLKNSFHSN